MSKFKRSLPDARFLFLAMVTPLAVTAQEADLYQLPDLLLNADSIATRESSESRIDDDTLQGEYAGAGLATVLQGIPGVSTQVGDGGDGELAINIRGLQDHGRVAVTIDGVRQNFAKSGHNANGTFAVDQEMLREVVVQRGPGGKPGAIGGSVEMRNVRADDLIDEDEAFGGELRLRYGTLTATPTLHGALATRLSEAVDLTFALTRADKDGYTAPDGTQVHAEQETASALATLGWTTAAGHRLSFTGTGLAQDYVVGLSTTTPDDTRLRKQTYSLNFESGDIWNGWTLDSGLYRTGMQVSQTELDATLMPTGGGRSYETLTTGLLIGASRAFTLGQRDHELSITLEGFRDQVETVAGTGSLTPSGQRDVWSLGIEDRVDFGAFSATFGLNFDRYELSAPGTRNSGSAVSPRIAINAPLGAHFHLFGQAALTFRPPTLNESLVNGVHPPPAAFDVRPNPDLRPERARSFELGLGYGRDSLFRDGDRLDLRATAFHNTVTDYISLEEVGTVFNNYFQYQNVQKARIKGLELEASYDADRFFASLSGQMLDGIDKTTGNELVDVAPGRVVVSAGVRSADQRSTFGARYTASAAKKSTNGASRTPAWETLDLFFNRDLTDTARFSLSLNNVLDKTYTVHLRTQPQPGFNALASLQIRF